MALEPGSRLGAYEITALIGVGGMGEVYRARDTVLRRDVALKTLPDAGRLNQDLVQRFEREARLLASLNHPNIATLHGFEKAGDVHALVPAAQTPTPIARLLSLVRAARSRPAWRTPVIRAMRDVGFPCC